MKTLALMITALMMTGCTYNYSRHLTQSSLADIGLRDRHQYVRYHDWTISPDTSIAVVLMDVREQIFPRSYQALHSALNQQFSQHFTSVSFVSGSTRTGDNLAAFHTGHQLLVRVELVDVKNLLNTRRELDVSSHHYPGRSYGRDRLTLRFSVYEAQTHSLLDTITLTSEAAYFKDGDTIALDLIEKALSNMLAALSGSPRSVG